jgi:hypothetical protein
MPQVSKPILGLLLSAVALLAMVMFVFKGGSGGAGASQSPGVYQSAINQAHQAVGKSNAANARLGAPVATTPAGAPAHRSVITPKHVKVATPAKATSATSHSQAQASEVARAIAQHKVVGLLFYNPQASDDAAVKAELAAAATKPGVVKVAVPVNNISSFKAITDTVPVVSSPTLIIVDRDGNASTITGFADRLEIGQRLNDALSSK